MSRLFGLIANDGFYSVVALIFSRLQAFLTCSFSTVFPLLQGILGNVGQTFDNIWVIVNFPCGGLIKDYLILIKSMPQINVITNCVRWFNFSYLLFRSCDMKTGNGPCCDGRCVTWLYNWLFEKQSITRKHFKIKDVSTWTLKQNLNFFVIITCQGCTVNLSGNINTHVTCTNNIVPFYP